MIRWMKGDIFRAPVEALVNPVNTVGVAGKGLALQFRERFPDWYRAYREACLRGEVRVGRIHVFPLTPPKGKLRFILSFPTKEDWRKPSRLEYIEAGLEDLVRRVEGLGIASLAVPALGAGLGGLAWEEVKPLLAKALHPLQAEVWVYEPR